MMSARSSRVIWSARERWLVMEGLGLLNNRLAWVHHNSCQCVRPRLCLIPTIFIEKPISKLVKHRSNNTEPKLNVNQLRS